MYTKQHFMTSCSGVNSFALVLLFFGFQTNIFLIKVCNCLSFHCVLSTFSTELKNVIGFDNIVIISSHF